MAFRVVDDVAVHQDRGAQVSLAARGRTGLFTRRQRADAIRTVHQDVKRQHPRLRAVDALTVARRHVANVAKGLR